MIKKVLIVLVIAALAVLAVACQQSPESNVNAGEPVATTAGNAATTKAGPDNSEITTTTDANGMKTETRVFRDNPRLSKVVVVTTREGKRTVKVYARNGEARELKTESERALEATGDALANAVGWVAKKAQNTSLQTSDVADTVAEKTTAGAKKVGEETKEGAKKTGRKIKKIVNP